MLQNILNNRYRLIEKIDDDGIGARYRGEDMSDGMRPVLIRLLRKEFMSSHLEDIIQIKNMAMVLSRINHPNIARIIEVLETGDGCWMIMEHAGGMSLAELISSKNREQSGSLSLDDALAITAQIAQGLEQAHGAGIVHGGIMPDVIIITIRKYRPGVAIIDFGLARIIDYAAVQKRLDPGAAPESPMPGVFSFLAPELISQKEFQPDERSDLYSLGVLFYGLVAGRPPFAGADIGSMVHQHLAKIPDPPSKYNSAAPAVIEAIIARLLDKNPLNRYQSARGLLNDLALFEAGNRGFIPGLRDRLVGLEEKPAFIDRDELPVLLGQVDNLSKGRGGIWICSGEQGMGKTALVSELGRRARARGIMVISVSCFSNEQRTPYRAITDALQVYVKYFGAYPEPKKEALRKNIKTAINELSGDLLRLHPELKQIIVEASPLVKLDRTRENRRFIMTAASFLLHLARSENGLVILLDDLHWADAGTLSLLEAMVQDIESFPLLIVGTAKKEETGFRLGALMNHARTKKYALISIPLAPFTSGMMGRFIAALLRRAEDDPAVCMLSNAIQERVRGNPFFAVELMRRLFHESAIASDAGGHLVVDEGVLGTLGIPDSMAVLLLGRISRLPDDDQEVLSLAAVLGRRFTMPELTRLGDVAEGRFLVDSVAPVLDRAFAMGFVEQDPCDRDCFIFTHESIRDAFYSGLETEKRKAVHVHATVILEEQYQDIIKQDVSACPALFDIANHAIAGGDRVRILRYAYLAGQRAKAEYAHDEAIAYLSQVINCAKGDDALSDELFIAANKSIGEIYITTGNFTGALYIYNSLLPLAKNPRDRATLYYQLCMAYFGSSQWGACEENAREGLRLLGERLPVGKIGVLAGILKELLAQGLRSLALLSPRIKNTDAVKKYKQILWYYYPLSWIYVTNDTLKFVRAILRMRNLAESRIGRSRELGTALALYAALLMAVRRYAKSMEYHERALCLRRDLNDQWGIAQSYQLMGIGHYYRGEFARSIEFLEQSRALFAQIGDSKEQGTTIMWMVFNLLAMAEYDRESRALDELFAIAEKTQDPYLLCATLLNRGYLQSIRGDTEQALALLFQALDLGRDNGILTMYCIVHIPIAEVFLSTGDSERAIEFLERARVINREHNLFESGIDHLYYILAEAYLVDLEKKTVNGRERRALVKRLYLTAKTALSRTRSSPLNYGPSLRVFAQYHAFVGNQAAAEKYFTLAIAQDERTGASLSLARSIFAYGLFLDRIGKAQDARARIETAYGLFCDIGASRYGARAAEFLGIDSADPVPWQRQFMRSLREQKNIRSVFELVNDISAGTDPALIMDRALSMVMELSGASRGCIVTLDEQGDFKIMAFRDMNVQDIDIVVKTVIYRTFTTEATILLNDDGSAVLDQVLQGIGQDDRRSCLSAPILYKNRALAVCYMDNQLVRGIFRQDDADAVQTILKQISVLFRSGHNQPETEKTVELEPPKEFCSAFAITNREKEIIRLLIKGHTRSEIAAELNIAYYTVKSHIGNIFTKTGVKSNIELINTILHYTRFHQ